MTWYDDAICSDSGLDFFPDDPEDAEELKEICFNCPVRKDCLQYALNTQTRFGVWGGADERTLRKALGVDQFGKPVKRERISYCPYCESSKITVSETNRTKIRLTCEHCDLSWWARRTTKVVEIDAEEDLEGLGMIDP